mmetsp:Transcript_12825/g.32917  ORF Transcript_12825/g.32917 Transcript_12825/m.32917 type:complete len:272 (-) Transcript_12825:1273-2088(-)
MQRAAGRHARCAACNDAGDVGPMAGFISLSAPVVDCVPLEGVFHPVTVAKLVVVEVDAAVQHVAVHPRPRQRVLVVHNAVVQSPAVEDAGKAPVGLLLAEGGLPHPVGGKDTACAVRYGAWAELAAAAKADGAHGDAVRPDLAAADAHAQPVLRHLLVRPFKAIPAPARRHRADVGSVAGVALLVNVGAEGTHHRRQSVVARALIAGAVRLQQPAPSGALDGVRRQLLAQRLPHVAPLVRGHHQLPQLPAARVLVRVRVVRGHALHRGRRR